MLRLVENQLVLILSPTIGVFLDEADVKGWLNFAGQQQLFYTELEQPSTFSGLTYRFRIIRSTLLHSSSMSAPE